MKRRMPAHSLVVAVLVSAALAGCTPVEPPFAAPTSCTELLGSDLETQFLDEGNVLFSDRDGNGIFPGDPIGQDGGDPYACLYGQDGVDLSTFELSAQPVDEEEHEGIIAVLGSGGFVQADEADRVVFTQEGDEGATPAIVHYLYPNGWITAYSTFGGADRLAEITGWADTVVEQVLPGS